MGFIIGALAGAVVMLLYAPKSGDITREELRVQTEELRRRAEELQKIAQKLADDASVKGRERIVAVKKVFRATGIDEVGRDAYHETFFEMLGNFSIGDYGKKEAIEWGWELLTKVFGFDGSKLVATVHTSDDEAYDIWTKTLKLLPPEKVFRLGDANNFWAPGPTGLCGPDSEVFIDNGPQPGVPEHDCSPADDCGRWLEIWNFVFQQYDRKADGTLVPLPKKNIDTGAGLERIAQVLQGVSGDTYRTDLFQPLVKKIESLPAKKYGH